MKKSIEETAENFRKLDWKEIRKLSQDEINSPWKYFGGAIRFLGDGKDSFYEFSDGSVRLNFENNILYANGNPSILNQSKRTA